MQPVQAGMHKLPPLPYAYNALEPVIDAETLQIHHSVLHKKYIDGLNKAELALVDSRSSNDYTYIKFWEKELAFNGSGNILHSLYFQTMAPVGNATAPGQKTSSMINWYFGSFDGFKAQFMSATIAVEGCGWGILGYNTTFHRLEILQCEKHQNLTQWGIVPILVCDVWEHAYYLTYQSMRHVYALEWWKIVNWNEVERLLGACQPFFQ